MSELGTIHYLDPDIVTWPPLLPLTAVLLALTGRALVASPALHRHK